MCFSLNSYAVTKQKLKPFETTRLTQTGGAGVASLLINESTILNPASIHFFKDSTMYYQRTSEKLKEESDSRAGNYKDGLSEFYNISDTTNALKGAFSYVYQNGDAGKRRRFSLSSAGAIGEKTAVGLSLAYIHERTEIKRGNYTQVTLGLTHNASKNLIFGFTYTDPLISISEYSNYQAGVQYVLSHNFTFMVDAGSGDVKNPKRTAFTKAALQVEATKSLFFRYGIFHDKFNGEKGAGYGVSWVGPKFAIDLALKDSKRVSGKISNLLSDERLQTFSFGITGLF